MHDALEMLSSLSDQQKEALRRRDFKTVLQLDRQAEQAVSDKERAFGVLTEHMREHGC